MSSVQMRESDATTSVGKLDMKLEVIVIPVSDVDRAKQFYERAFQALPPADRRAQRPGLIMAAIYRTLLDEIQRDGFRVLTQRTSLTPLRKFWLAWRTWVAA